GDAGDAGRCRPGRDGGVRGLRLHTGPGTHGAVLLGVLRRLPGTGQGPRLRGGPGGAVGAGGAAHGAVGPAAAVRARPAVRDRGGLVVVAGGVGAHGVLADPRGTARGRRPGRPRGDRRGAAAGPQGQVGGEGVDARRRVPRGRPRLGGPADRAPGPRRGRPHRRPDAGGRARRPHRGRRPRPVTGARP